MKKIQILLLTLLIPFLGHTQSSWIQIQLLTDDFPIETSWNILGAYGDTIIQNGILDINTLYDTIIEVEGDIVLNVVDAFGDGLGASQWNGTDGWFLIQNSCQDTISYVAGDFGLLYTDTLTIAPCAPPIPGCTDSIALNYDPNAFIENGTCTYPACDGILSSNAYQDCYPGGQVLVTFEWMLGQYNPSCETVKVWYSTAEGQGPYQYSVQPNTTTFAVNAGNGQMPPNWSVEHYLQVEFADGTMSDTITYTPTPCIDGCTDPTQPSYNPWATNDDGSCSGTTCDLATEYQITMEITFDNWPSETSWIMNSVEVLDSAAQGDYDFNDIGQTYTYDFCIDQGEEFELIVNDSYGDGMAGSTSGGTMDGTIVIYDCNGDTIWFMDNPGFGDTLYSGPQVGVVCNVTSDILGCMDDDYQEFNPQANVDDGTCTNLHVYGCTNPGAFNYDSTATMMDLVPDCNYELWIGDAGGDGWGNSYIGVYQNGIDLGTYTMGPGTYEQTFNVILDPGVPVEVFYFEVGGPQQPPQEVQFQTWHNSFKLTNADGFILLYEGQNPFADNGNGALQEFDSPFFVKYVSIPFCGNSCIPTILGCMDATAFNYNPIANTNDGNCIQVVLGCTNDLAFNYNPLANVDDNSCQSIITGCMDLVADNYNVLANTDDGSCYYIGCMDVIALNYDSTATVSSGCIYPIPGCTDPTSFNYDPLANIDNGLCVDIVYGCMDATAFNYDLNANTDNGSCISYIYGCTDSTAFNYNVNANTNNGSCIDVLLGCIDNTALNFDPLANTLDNSCCYIGGCTDSLSINYNENACFNDNSCITAVPGCTDVSAYNYDPIANVTDSIACLYNAGCYGGPGIPYWLNDGCFAWVIDVDDYCCTNDWDASCQSMYDYCQLGWPTSIEDVSSLGIVVYPNPTKNIITIETRLEIEIEVYDMMGRLLIEEKNTKRLDLSILSNGLYNLSIIYNNKRYSKQIIKQ